MQKIIATLIVLFTCILLANINASANADAKDYSQYLGIWVNEPHSGKEKFEKLWAEFTFDKNDQLVVNRAKIAKNDGVLHEKKLNHAETRQWIDEELNLIDLYTMEWLINGKAITFKRTTLPLDTAKNREIFFANLSENVKNAVSRHQWLYAEPSTLKSANKLQTAINSLNSLIFTQEVLTKTQTVQSFLNFIDKTSENLIKTMDRETKSKFINILRKVAIEISNFVAASSCISNSVNLNDYYKLEFGKTLCDGKILSTESRSRAAIKLATTKNTAVVIKIMDNTDIPNEAAAAILKKSFNVSSASKSH